MSRYSEERRQAVVTKLLPPHHLSAYEAAEQERRSLANRIEVMIRDYCGRHGVAVREQSRLFGADDK